MSFEDDLVHNSKSIAALVSEDVYYINFFPNQSLEVTDFMDGFAAYEKLTKGIPYKVIIEFGTFVQVSSEAREFAQLNKQQAKAEALIVKSLGQRMLVNFYIKLKLQAHPTKVFKDFKEAINWLNTLG
jgi:hypothetical protein